MLFGEQHVFFRTRLIQIHYLVFKDQMTAMIEMTGDALFNTEVYLQKRLY